MNVPLSMSKVIGFGRTDGVLQSLPAWRQRRSTLMWLGIAMLVMTASAVLASETSPDPGPCPAAFDLSGDQVAAMLMSRNVERAQKLLGHESVRDYSLDYSGFPSPRRADMRVKAVFSAPGTKDFTVVSETGSKLIRDRVLHRLLQSEKEASSDEANRDAVALTTANYHFALLGCTTGGIRPLFVMQIEPLRANKFLYRGTIWVDAQDFAVWRIEAQPAQNPSFWIRRSEIHHQYEKIGEFYLPALNETVTDVRLGGKAVLTIRYRDYKLSSE